MLTGSTATQVSDCLTLTHGHLDRSFYLDVHTHSPSPTAPSPHIHMYVCACVSGPRHVRSPVSTFTSCRHAVTKLPSGNASSARSCLVYVLVEWRPPTTPMELSLWTSATVTSSNKPVNSTSSVTLQRLHTDTKYIEPTQSY